MCVTIMLTCRDTKWLESLSHQSGNLQILQQCIVTGRWEGAVCEPSSESYTAIVFETGTPGDNKGNVSWTQGMSRDSRCEICMWIMCFIPILSPFLFIPSIYASFFKFVGFSFACTPRFRYIHNTVHIIICICVQLGAYETLEGWQGVSNKMEWYSAEC